MLKPRAPVPLDRALYREVQRVARSYFEVFPSAYANAWVVQEYLRRGGRYGGVRAAGGLTRWFGEEWVDISRPRADGSYPPCGRPAAARGAYPKCVPAAKAADMTESERRSAVRRKRRAESAAPEGPRAPIRVRTRAR